MIEIFLIPYTGMSLCAGKTGVEMETRNGVSLALLTIWDVVRSAGKDGHGQYPVTRIEEIRM